MVSIHNGEISKNFQIFKPIETTPNNSKFKIYHDNKELFLQLPRTSIYSILQPFENMYRITLKFNLNDTLHAKFLDKLTKIEAVIKKTEKELWRTLGKNIRNKEWISSIRFSENSKNAYMKLTCDSSIISVFDHNKKEQTINYIIKNSEAICIIYLKHIWRNKNNIGLGWNLFQTKIFQPIHKINECIIFDEFEDNPLMHYFNVPTIMNDKPKITNINKEEDPIFGKYVKLKRLGANPNIIALKLSQDGYTQKDFNDFMDGKKLERKTANNPGKITSSMFKNVKLKKAKAISKNKNIVKKSNNQCVVTEESLAFAIKSLKKV